MSEINKGGTAFPCVELDHHERVYAQNLGMTLRDYFAAKAMQSIAGTPLFTEGSLFPHEVAQHAYELADAMLKAREA